MARRGWPEWPSARPLGRLGEAEDVAQVILAVHGMDWVTGQVVECDGGLAALAARSGLTPAKPRRVGS